MPLNSILSTVQTQFNRYVCPTCLTFGIIGCLLNILLFSRQQFRNISCCTYFLAASIGMLIAVCFGFIPFAYSANHPNPINTISLFCKIRSYIGQSSMMIHRWLMTMACIDRYMVSSNSVRLRGFANPRIAYRIVLINVIIWIILPVHNLIFLDIRGGFCAFPLATAAIYHSIFTIITGCLLPILIMIICAALISYNLASKRERHRQRNIHSQIVGQAARLLRARDHQVVVYSLSVIPWTSFIAFTTFTRDVINKSTNRLAIEAFLRYLTEIIAYIYPTLSFYIYTLTSHTYRRQLIKTVHSILTCRNRCCVRPRRIRPVMGNT